MRLAELARRSAVAVIDVGSNSGRVVVYTRDEAGQLRLLAGARAPLRLVREVDDRRELGPEAAERLLEALRDFRAIARGAGARRIAAVATAAMRDAADGPALLRRVKRELGFSLEIIDGRREARYGVVGALHGLPLRDGLLFDLGGGSLQLTRFRARRPGRALSLPLGALRVSQAFLQHDPPTPAELRRLRRHVRRLLEGAGLEPLRRGQALVGTGGTLRNLAKVDRWARGYPITRVHGYELGRARLSEIVEDLAHRRQRTRDRVHGLSDDRADSIVGGALVIDTLVEACGAAAVHVSGQGVREGLAHTLLGEPLPSVEDVRAASVASLGARFDAWDRARAEQRAALATRLWSALPALGGPELREALRLAALLLDTGASVDFFERHEHAADIALATDLNGFSQREIALVAALLRQAGDAGHDIAGLRPLLHEGDRAAVERAAVLLVLADDIQERCPPTARVRLSCRLARRSFTVSAPALLSWRPRGLGRRFERAFGRRLVVQHGARGQR